MPPKICNVPHSALCIIFSYRFQIFPYLISLNMGMESASLTQRIHTLPSVVLNALYKKIYCGTQSIYQTPQAKIYDSCLLLLLLMSPDLHFTFTIPGINSKLLSFESQMLPFPHIATFDVPPQHWQFICKTVSFPY